MNKFLLNKNYYSFVFALFFGAFTSLSAQTFQYSDFSSGRQFTTISNTTSGGQTRNMIAYGDFNGDGLQDIVKAWGSNVVILENNYSGGDITDANTNLFNLLPTMATYSTVKNVIVGDVNQDGKLDIIAGGDTKASLFINTSENGEITFATRVDYTAKGPNVELFDVDGDGYLDLVHSRNSYFTEIGITLYDSVAGDFSSTIYSFTVTYGSMEDWTFADFDGDGTLDFFSARADSNSSLTGIWLAKNTSTPGTISFEALEFREISGMAYASYGSPKAIDAADFDNDGKVDAIVQLGNKTHFFLNTNPVGQLDINNFTESNIVSQSSTSNFGLNYAIGDIDNDGKLDVVSPGSNSSGTFVLKNVSTAGSISFESYLNVLSITNQTALLVDLDGDALPEIVNGRYYSDLVYVVKYLGPVGDGEDTSGTLANVDEDIYSFNVYPNPIKTHLNITSSHQVNTTYSVYSLSGKQIMSPIESKTVETKIEVSNLEAGIYILEAKNEFGIVREKLIKM